VHIQDYLDRGIQTDQRIGWLLDRARRRWPTSPALTFEGRTLSYEQLWRWVTDVSCYLVKAGLKPGDRLLWQLPNSLECVVLQLACWRSGICSVGVVPIYRQHELRQIIAEMQPVAIAAENALGSRRPVEEHDELLAELNISPLLKLVVGGSSPGWSNFPREPGADRTITDKDLPRPAEPGDCCLIYFTSGTSSAPKGVMHSSRALLATAHAWRDYFEFSSADCSVLGTPYARLATVLAAVIVPALCGARAVLMRQWSPEIAVQVCEAERGTFACGAPIFLEDFVSRYEQGESGSHRLTKYMVGGAPISPELVRRAQAVGVTAWRVYGMTELPFGTTNLPWASLEERAVREGSPAEGTEVEIVDEELRPLPPRRLGQIRLRSAYQMIGYTDPQQHAASIDADGWFYTGDIGELSEDGVLSMRGRIKDLINRGGEKFSALDIEQLLLRHSAIAEAAVVGVPDDRFGQAVLAVVALKDGKKWPGDAAMVEHLVTQSIDPRKVPAHWQTLPKLPRTLSGKVQKYELAEKWQTEVGRANSNVTRLVSSVDPNA